MGPLELAELLLLVVLGPALAAWAGAGAIWLAGFVGSWLVAPVGFIVWLAQGASSPRQRREEDRLRAAQLEQSTR
jgi:hypothetical protein